MLVVVWGLEAFAAAARAAEPGTPSEHQSARRACEHAWNEAARRFAEAVARLDAHEDSATPDSFVAERSAFARLGFASALEATGRLDEAAVAYEETERRHPELEAALVAIDRRRTLPGADNVALRRRAVRRIEGLSDNGRMLSADAWRLWFDAEDSTAPRLAQGAGG